MDSEGIVNDYALTMLATGLMLPGLPCSNKCNPYASMFKASDSGGNCVLIPRCSLSNRGFCVMYGLIKNSSTPWGGLLGLNALWASIASTAQSLYSGITLWNTWYSSSNNKNASACSWRVAPFFPNPALPTMVCSRSTSDRSRGIPHVAQVYTWLHGGK